MPTDRSEGTVTPEHWTSAIVHLARCVARTGSLIATCRLHQPHRNLGRQMTFADGTIGTVYRETIVNAVPVDPAVLVVAFRLRGVRGWGHAVFRAESLLNTALFAGFPGFVSKLWLTADDQGRYRGVYQWDGTGLAEDYVRTLWWPLAVVSHRDSIRFHVLTGQRRDVFVSGSVNHEADVDRSVEESWWRLRRTTPPLHT
ncbi:hypothetical protein EV641_10472 [Rhodococcus sp. SMB37]|uniref:hypothetical protein n=1 Tax=Rhodococcus sp. SMB37 TaxID=2512213 RepID=UPI0010EB8282|nr:hypothetical protein [Rhodococcus sp. SMB37]TCN54809.1 hypothetical protein EV641_10472 [Rhodococcus sp. SMB37]